CRVGPASRLARPEAEGSGPAVTGRPTDRPTSQFPDPTSQFPDPTGQFPARCRRLSAPDVSARPFRVTMPVMQTRRFGRLGWQVSEIGYGMWGMGGWSGSDDEQSLASLDAAVSRGVTFF